MDCNNLPPCYHPEVKCMCFMNPAGEQFCGYLLSDGKTVRPCAPNCCNGGLGCPGQCRGVAPKRPDYTIVSETGGVESNSVFPGFVRIKKFENIITLLIVLLLVSTLCLFIRI